MIRHLLRLIRPVEDAPWQRAIAVYAEPHAGGWRTVAAADQGFEGVACVDDAARAAIVFLRLHTRGNRRDPAGEVARGLLCFVASMQAVDGRFTNFIVDWAGRKNARGPTSVLGGPWSDRAAHALAVGANVLGEHRLADAARRGLDACDLADENLDVHAVAALAARELWIFSGDPADSERARQICEVILAGGDGTVLRDHTSRPDIHLWGHLQEAALAEVGLALADDRLVVAAQRSAQAVLVPALDRLATASCQPFEASCVAAGLTSVARASGSSQLTAAARAARAWFYGSNAARQPVYNVERGVVYDGVDSGRVSKNAGAEASIEGANALLETLVDPWFPPPRPRRPPAAVLHRDGLRRGEPPNSP